MFKKYHTVTILDSKWKPILTNVKLTVIPRANEYIYLNNQYYQVMNIIHTIDKKQGIFIVIGEIVRPDNHMIVA